MASSPRPTFDTENALGRDQGMVMCGVDEVGRGPLAGPVLAAAVVIPQACMAPWLNIIHDSKKLSAAARDRLAPQIMQDCLHFIASASVEEIATNNILRASLLAMRRAVEGLCTTHNLTLHHALIDGNKLPILPCPATALVKGDARSLSIAAASIIAKVARDEIMQDLSRQFPHYGWERNAGYGTASHIAALRTHGITPHHRRGFAPVAALIDQQPFVDKAI